VKLCAGLPLALRLAGSHLALDATERGGVPDVAAYVKLLGSGRLAHLDADAADAGEVTISETLRLSEAGLPEPERGAWRGLGVFTVSFDARAAQAVAGADDAMLVRFLGRSLLEREGTERFKVHDLAAEYACAQLASEALTALHLSHARHYTEVGDEADSTYLKGDAVGGLALFDRERAQIEVAWAWLAEREGEAAARQLIALVDAVAYTIALRFQPRQRIAWRESQLRAARLVGDQRGEGKALGNLGDAHADLGDARQAIGYFEQALLIDREIGYKPGEGSDLWNSARAHASLGNRPEAIARAAAALEIYEAIAHPSAAKVRAKLAEWRAT
jgi:tetratricopeptide (TPR) repeat protein